MRIFFVAQIAPALQGKVVDETVSVEERLIPVLEKRVRGWVFEGGSETESIVRHGTN